MKVAVLSLLIMYSICFGQVAAQNVTPTAYGLTTNINYVRTWVAISPDTSTNNFTVNSPVTQSNMATRYLDGLGRPIETVVKQGSLITDPANPASSANAVDMMNSNVYDDFGREPFKYLPFAVNTTGGNTSLKDGLFKLNPFQEQAAFYDNANAVNPVKGQGETYFYAQTDYEPSPLNRVIKTSAPGNSWVGSGRGVETGYYVNTTTDDVKIWSVTDGASGTFGTYAATGTYAAGELYKIITTDEAGHQVIEFKDKEGQIILKKVQLTATADDGTGSGHTGWLCTYYIYDDLNNLRCVIQPRGVELMPSLSWALTDPTILAEQCFRYEYDQRQRIIMKKVPGAGAVNMVYDARDRLVMTQNADMYAQGKYLVTKYDGLNRPEETGLWSNGTSVTTHRTNAASSTSYPVTSSGYEMLSQTFYDNYDWVSGSGSPITNTGYENTYDTYLDAASNSTWPYPQANAQSLQVTGMVTGSKTKELGTSNTFLYSINIYDDKGRVIQVKSTNVSNGTDMATTQYSWAGQPLIIVQKQEKAGTPAQTSVVVTQYTYDDLGRLAKTEKKLSNTLVNSNAMSAYNTLSTMEYDALGHLKKKILAPDYNNGAGLESLTYDYNIRGWLLGMNRAYLKDETAQGYADNYFGFDLGYDKYVSASGSGGNGGYNNVQYNGNITGTIWKSKGDQVRRKYDFQYDNVNRFGKATYTQNKTAGGSWDATEADYSVFGFDADNNWMLKYDANGNILSMIQRGYTIANPATIVDALRYEYNTGSNKLKRVTDDDNDKDSKLGDFKYDPATKGSTDYSYDDNGNLISDANKKISSITYNYLNLPSVITVTGKGTITYTYDAGGNKLQKVTQENNATVPYNSVNYTSNITTTTTYAGGLVYESKSYSNGSLSTLNYTDKLQFIPDEEGRIRSTTNASQPWAFDYFLKDHLGNVRMVLTDEQKQDAYPPASMETAQATTEEALYANVNTTRVDKPAGYPSDTYTNPNDKVAKVNGSGNKIGPSIVLKVMAGDKFNIRVSSWYKKNGVNPGSPNSVATDLATGLINSLTGTGGPVHGIITSAQLTNSGVMPTTVNDFLSNQPAPGTIKPKAYLNWVLLDEQFKFVQDGSSAEQVGDDQEFKTFTKTNLPVTKNGYLYVYVSNETPNIDVFFDNLQVTHIHGPLMEETHYYPFGLTMAGISSKALNNAPENKYKFNKGSELQNKEFSDGSGLELYATNLRSLDPQLGRWWQIDSKPDYSQSLYSSMGNNPIMNMDPFGDTLLNKADHIMGDRLEKELNSKNRSLGNQASRLSNRIAKATAKGNTEKVGNLKNKLNGINSQISTNTTSICHLDAISSDTKHAYTFNILPSGSKVGGTVLGIGKNSSGQEKIAIVMNVTNDVNAVHELTHAYQGGIENSIKPIPDGSSFPGPNLFSQQMVNAISEIEAYQAQYGFDENSLPASKNGGTPQNFNSINIPYVGGIMKPGSSTEYEYPNVNNLSNSLFQVLTSF